MRYDLAGRLRTIPGAVSNLTYAADGKTTKAVYANGISTTFTYDSWRAWPTSVVHAEAGTAFETRTYDHDAAGRITRITATTPGESWTYTYDRLDRLTRATNLDDDTRTRNYWYDLGSRFTAGGGNGAYGYDPARPHAPVTVGGNPLVWDATGNMTTGLGRTHPALRRRSGRSSLAEVHRTSPSAAPTTPHPGTARTARRPSPRAPPPSPSPTPPAANASSSR